MSYTPKYWNNEGKYTPLLDKVWEKLVPSSGESKSIVGEVVRSFGRINYELGNNGGGNMVDGEFDDYSDEIVDPFIVDYFADMFMLLRRALNSPTVDEVRTLSLEYATTGMSGSSCENSLWKAVDALGDEVGEWVENTLIEVGLEKEGGSK